MKSKSGHGCHSEKKANKKAKRAMRQAEHILTHQHVGNSALRSSKRSKEEGMEM